jgi:hypothetical protein
MLTMKVSISRVVSKRYEGKITTNWMNEW